MFLFNILQRIHNFSGFPILLMAMGDEVTFKVNAIQEDSLSQWFVWRHSKTNELETVTLLYEEESLLLGTIEI